MIEGIEPIERDYTSDIIAYIEGNVSSFEFPVGLTSIGNYAFQNFNSYNNFFSTLTIL